MASSSSPDDDRGVFLRCGKSVPLRSLDPAGPFRDCTDAALSSAVSREIDEIESGFLGDVERRPIDNRRQETVQINVSPILELSAGPPSSTDDPDTESLSPDADLSPFSTILLCCSHCRFPLDCKNLPEPHGLEIQCPNSECDVTLTEDDWMAPFLLTLLLLFLPRFAVCRSFGEKRLPTSGSSRSRDVGDDRDRMTSSDECIRMLESDDMIQNLTRRFQVVYYDGDYRRPAYRKEDQFVAEIRRMWTCIGNCLSGKVMSIGDRSHRSANGLGYNLVLRYRCEDCARKNRTGEELDACEDCQGGFRLGSMVIQNAFGDTNPLRCGCVWVRNDYPDFASGFSSMFDLCQSQEEFDEQMEILQQFGLSLRGKFFSTDIQSLSCAVDFRDLDCSGGRFLHIKFVAPHFVEETVRKKPVGGLRVSVNIDVGSILIFGISSSPTVRHPRSCLTECDVLDPRFMAALSSRLISHENCLLPHIHAQLIQRKWLECPMLLIVFSRMFRLTVGRYFEIREMLARIRTSNSSFNSVPVVFFSSQDSNRLVVRLMKAANVQESLCPQLFGSLVTLVRVVSPPLSGLPGIRSVDTSPSDLERQIRSSLVTLCEDWDRFVGNEQKHYYSIFSVPSFRVLSLRALLQTQVDPRLGDLLRMFSPPQSDDVLHQKKEALLRVLKVKLDYPHSLDDLKTLLQSSDVNWNLASCIMSDVGMLLSDDLAAARIQVLSGQVPGNEILIADRAKRDIETFCSSRESSSKILSPFGLFKKKMTGSLIPSEHGGGCINDVPLLGISPLSLSELASRFHGLYCSEGAREEEDLATKIERAVDITLIPDLAGICAEIAVTWYLVRSPLRFEVSRLSTRFAIEFVRLGLELMRKHADDFDYDSQDLPNQIVSRVFELTTACTHFSPILGIDVEELTTESILSLIAWHRILQRKVKSQARYSELKLKLKISVVRCVDSLFDMGTVLNSRRILTKFLTMKMICELVFGDLTEALDECRRLAVLRDEKIMKIKIFDERVERVSKSPEENYKIVTGQVPMLGELLRSDLSLNSALALNQDTLDRVVTSLLEAREFGCSRDLRDLPMTFLELLAECKDKMEESTNLAGKPVLKRTEVEKRQNGADHWLFCKIGDAEVRTNTFPRFSLLRRGGVDSSSDVAGKLEFGDLETLLNRKFMPRVLRCRLRPLYRKTALLLLIAGSDAWMQANLCQHARFRELMGDCLALEERFEQLIPRYAHYKKALLFVSQELLAVTIAEAQFLLCENAVNLVDKTIVLLDRLEKVVGVSKRVFCELEALRIAESLKSFPVSFRLSSIYAPIFDPMELNIPDRGVYVCYHVVENCLFSPDRILFWVIVDGFVVHYHSALFNADIFMKAMGCFYAVVELNASGLIYGEAVWEEALRNQDEAAMYLYDLLVAPVEAFLPFSPPSIDVTGGDVEIVHFVTCGKLDQVPFWGLKDRHSQYYLVELFCPAVTSSLRVHQLNAEARERIVKSSADRISSLVIQEERRLLVQDPRETGGQVVGLVGSVVAGLNLCSNRDCLKVDFLSDEVPVGSSLKQFECFLAARTSTAVVIVWFLEGEPNDAVKRVRRGVVDGCNGRGMETVCLYVDAKCADLCACLGVAAFPSVLLFRDAKRCNGNCIRIEGSLSCFELVKRKVRKYQCLVEETPKVDVGILHPRKAEDCQEENEGEEDVEVGIGNLVLKCGKEFLLLYFYSKSKFVVLFVALTRSIYPVSVLFQPSIFPKPLPYLVKMVFRLSRLMLTKMRFVVLATFSNHLDSQILTQGWRILCVPSFVVIRREEISEVIESGRPENLFHKGFVVRGPDLDLIRLLLRPEQRIVRSGSTGCAEAVGHPSQVTILSEAQLDRKSLFATLPKMSPRFVHIIGHCRVDQQSKQSDENVEEEEEEGEVADGEKPKKFVSMSRSIWDRFRLPSTLMPDSLCISGSELIKKLDCSSVELLFLSSCSSQEGELRQIGTLNLLSAISSSGVPSVICNIWRVRSTMMSDISQLFYHSLAWMLPERGKGRHLQGRRGLHKEIARSLQYALCEWLRRNPQQRDRVDLWGGLSYHC